MRERADFGAGIDAQALEAQGRHFTACAEQLRSRLSGLIFGQEALIEELLITLVAGGHLLIEGPPGVGKTLLARAAGVLFALDSARLQCTPDLLPADILGGPTLEEGPGGPQLHFRRGPIFCSLFFVDELNRASPRTQSALLEAMAERQVTLAGERHTLGPPFQVIATQNPIELAGTFPLPEAQADRFLFKSLVEIPSEEVLAELVDARPMHHLEALEACLESGELLRWQTHAATLPVAARLRRWIARLVAQSNPKHAPDSVAPYLSAGVSPRAVQAIADAARARATLYGRLHVEAEDLLAVARPSLRHRLQLHWRAQTEMLDREQLVTRLLEAQEQL